MIPVIGLIIAAVGVIVFNKEIHPVEGITLNFGETLAMIGMLMVLFPIVKAFYTTPLSEAILTRNRELEETFSEAEALRNEMTQLRSDYEAKLAATEAQARETIQAQIREAQSLRQSLMSEAQSRADALVANAQAEVTAERARLLSELRNYVTDLSLAAAEKVVGENMDNERNRRIVDDFINSADVQVSTRPDVSGYAEANTLS